MINHLVHLFHSLNKRSIIYINACITRISKDVFTLLHLSQIHVLSTSMSKIDFPSGKSYVYIDNTANMSIVITFIVTFKP